MFTNEPDASMVDRLNLVDGGTRLARDSKLRRLG